MLALVSEMILVWLCAMSLWMSLRVLRFPDLSLEVTAVGFAILAILPSLGGLPVFVAAVLVGASLLVLAVTLATLRIGLNINPILVALCASAVIYSLDLVLMQGPNVAIPGFHSPRDESALMLRLTLSLACATIIALFLRTQPGLQVLAAGANRALYARLHGRRRLWLMHAIGHLLAALPLAAFGWASAARSGYIDIGLTQGRLLQGLFVVLLTLAVHSRPRFLIAALAMLLPATLVVLVGRLLLEFGLPTALMSGLMAVLLLVGLLTLRARPRGFSIEEALRG